MAKVLVSNVHQAISNTLQTFTSVEQNHPLNGLATYILNYIKGLEEIIIADFTPSKVANVRVDALKVAAELLKVEVLPFDNILDAAVNMADEVINDPKPTESPVVKDAEVILPDVTEVVGEVAGCDPVADAPASQGASN